MSWNSYYYYYGTISVVVLLLSRWWYGGCRSRVDYSRKHCVITGGSQGLGKALAEELVSRGADVTIIARRQELLNETLAILETRRRFPDQKLLALSADVTDKIQVMNVVKRACDHSGTPYSVFTCAGTSIPGMFIETDLNVFEKEMTLNYFGTLYIVKTIVERMIHEKKKGKIILVTSTAALIGYAGNSQYVATKFALRGMADCLRNELAYHGIGVHVYYPPNMDTPGFEVEEQHKPQVSRSIEGSAGLLKPERAAIALLRGIDRNKYHITADVVSEAARILMNGMTPRNHVLVEILLCPLLIVIGALFRLYMDMLANNPKNRSSNVVSSSSSSS